MSPEAELLRRAITQLRTLASDAAAGPWEPVAVWSPDASASSAVYSHAHPTGTVDSEVVASGRIRDGYGGIRNPANALYIALMHPPVADAVADLIEAALPYADMPTRADYPIYVQAAGTARAVLREASS